MGGAPGARAPDARAFGGPLHVRRLTDGEARALFDPYHCRIIYQTFYGVRDVARPLAAVRRRTRRERRLFY